MKYIYNKNNIMRIWLSAVMLAMTCSSGCMKDYFDKQPLDAISDPTFWKTSKDAELALIGCYNIGAGWTAETFWMPRGLIYLDLMAGLGSEKELIPDHVTDGTLTASYGEIQAYWSNAYNKIARCNNFLDHIAVIDMEPDEKDMMSAEVRTIRSYELFNLALYYGGVPLPTHLLTVAEANAISRTPQKDVWTFCEKELLESFPFLPDTRPAAEQGRITKGAALAILGRVQMAEKKWKQAAETYKQIIDLGVYSIDESGYHQLFMQTGEHSKETILAAQFQEDTYGHVLPQYLYPEAYGGWHQFSPYNELVQTFECTDGKTIDKSPFYNSDAPYDHRDPRLYYTIMINGLTSFKGQTFISAPNSNSPDRMNKYNWSGYCINKFMDSTFDGNLMNYGGNFPMIRYAEVLLSYLESKMEAGDALNQPLLDLTINDVRSRASVNMPPVTALDPATLRPIIHRERTVEFAFEGLHYYDILRWGTVAKELNRQFTGMKLTNDPENYKEFPVDDNGFFIYQRRNFVPGKNELWPIPQSEIDINANLTQNAGY